MPSISRAQPGDFLAELRAMNRDDLKSLTREDLVRRITSLTRPDGSFVDVATLRTLFGQPSSPEPIVTCGSGLTASVLALRPGPYWI